MGARRHARRRPATLGPEWDQWVRGFLFSPALTVGGGTSEVLRNIIAERLLGLPHDHDVEQGKTWAESHGVSARYPDPSARCVVRPPGVFGLRGGPPGGAPPKGERRARRCRDPFVCPLAPAIFLVVVLAFAACGGGDDDDSASSPDSNDASTDQTGATPSGDAHRARGRPDQSLRGAGLVLRAGDGAARGSTEGDRRRHHRGLDLGHAHPRHARRPGGHSGSRSRSATPPTRPRSSSA